MSSYEKLVRGKQDGHPSSERRRLCVSPRPRQFTSWHAPLGESNAETRFGATTPSPPGGRVTKRPNRLGAAVFMERLEGVLFEIRVRLATGSSSHHHVIAKCNDFANARTKCGSPPRSPRRSARSRTWGRRNHSAHELIVTLPLPSEGLS
jgi:hypothetical protein